jgi:hypothetical protein
MLSERVNDEVLALLLVGELMRIRLKNRHHRIVQFAKHDSGESACRRGGPRCTAVSLSSEGILLQILIDTSHVDAQTKPLELRG